MVICFGAGLGFFLLLLCFCHLLFYSLYVQASQRNSWFLYFRLRESIGAYARVGPRQGVVVIFQLTRGFLHARQHCVFFTGGCEWKRFLHRKGVPLFHVIHVFCCHDVWDDALHMVVHKHRLLDYIGDSSSHLK